GVVGGGAAGGGVAGGGGGPGVAGGGPAAVEGGGAGDLFGGAPGAGGLGDDHCLGGRDAAGAAGGVVADGGAVAHRAARHRVDLREPAGVEGPAAGHLESGAPGAAGFGHHERLLVAGGVRVDPAGAALAGRGAGHREDRGARVALVERRGAGDFPGGAPGAVDLVDDERLLVVEGV